jgi:hypothetical protein
MIYISVSWVKIVTFLTCIREVVSVSAGTPTIPRFAAHSDKIWIIPSCWPRSLLSTSCRAHYSPSNARRHTCIVCVSDIVVTGYLLLQRHNFIREYCANTERKSCIRHRYGLHLRSRAVLRKCRNINHWLLTSDMARDDLAVRARASDGDWFCIFKWGGGVNYCI